MTSIEIPNSIIKIDNNAFSGCSALTSIVIPDSLESIAYGTFYGCTGLTSVMIPNSVTSIGTSAFQDCTNLISIEIPNTVTSIISHAFNGCISLRDITVGWETPLPLNSIWGVFNGINTSLVTLHVPCGTKELYQTANVWGSFGTISEDCPSTSTFFMDISTSSLSFTASGEQKTFTINSNTNWEVSSNASWLTVSPSSGIGDMLGSVETITVTVTENTNSSQRAATITVKSVAGTHTIDVTQAAGTTSVWPDSYYWPDSIITYTSEGGLDDKDVYDEQNKIRTNYKWENGTWVVTSTDNTSGFGLFKPGVSLNERSEYLYFVYPKVANRIVQYRLDKKYYNVEYGDNGKVVLIQISLHEDKIFDNYYSCNIQYNEDNNPVLIEEWNYTWNRRIYAYEYNEDGNVTYFEEYTYRDGVKMLITKETAEYDEQGRIVAAKYMKGNDAYDKYLLDGYTFYYYADQNNNNIDVSNNTPVSSDNKGDFDLNVNLPTDSVQNGSLVIQLPEGFTLDEANTSLTVEFAGLFDLIITKQEDNCWLIEIKCKSLKSSGLRSDEIGKMLQVAYKVDETLPKGTYDISIHSIQFETPGGDLIPEPMITLPVNVNRWGVANEKIDNSEISVYLINNTLYIETQQPDAIAIYMVNGVKIYDATIPAGTTTIDTVAFPQGMLIVKGKSGWNQKVISK